jgi:hypothetical protein
MRLLPFRRAIPAAAVAVAVLLATAEQAIGLPPLKDPLGPSQPKGVVATADLTSAHLSWVPGSGSPASYAIYLNGAFVATVPEPTREYAFWGLAPHTTYTLGVSAHNSHGTSAITSVTVVTNPPATNPFGIGFYSMATMQAIDLAKQVHARYVRNAAFLLSPGIYQHDPGVIRAAGLEQILNVHYVKAPSSGPPGPSTFPKDLADYQARVARAIDDVRPALVVVENEASYAGHFTGTSDQYGQMLAAAVQVGREKGVPVTTDGTISSTVVRWVYQGLLAEGKRSEADAFWALAAEKDQVKPTSPVLHNAWLDAYAAAQPDYLNIHFYWSEPSSLVTARDYLERAIGLPVVVNEWGIRSDDPALMTRLMDVLSERDFAQLWSKDTGKGTRSLYEANNRLRPIGAAFRDYISSHYAV